MIGASREMVSRVMKDLQTGGYIEMRGSTIVLRDTIMLPSGARGPPLRRSAKAAAPSRRLAGLLREARWLLLIAAGLYLLLIFATFQRSDPAGRTARPTRSRAMAAGRSAPGWRTSFFISSACPRTGGCAVRVHRGLGLPSPRRHAARRRPRRICAADRLERCARAPAHVQPLGRAAPCAGGLVGDALGVPLASALGLTGATLALLTFTAIGFSLFIGVSWLTIFEAVGTGLEKAYAAAFAAWDRRRDRKLGSRAREEREAQVQIEKRREDEHPPLRIEPALAEIKKSERVQKERQAPLFEHLPDTPLGRSSCSTRRRAGARPSPPRRWNSPSRLIEKKLSDFGVAVKVLAAYPGPVITRYEIEPPSASRAARSSTW